MNTARPLSMAHWLAASAPRPDAVLDLWAQGRTATVVTGPYWDTVEIPLGLSSRTATFLTYRGHHIGPHLLCGAERTAWWLVPTGGGQTLADVGQLRVLPPGCPIIAPRPGAYTGNRLWILPEPTIRTPRPWLRLTSPQALRAAIGEAGRSRPPSRVSAPAAGWRS
ncbi:hypothetical protein AB0I49_26350 [Streptomyces sp. NPDC050617]|uniref:hypothetical protein n=1 Tax=Streptomyces sp. NPDC050617 TaxID=3154628 RepID=UPI003431D0C7